jgi:hypothetical protein
LSSATAVVDAARDETNATPTAAATGLTNFELLAIGIISTVKKTRH